VFPEGGCTISSDFKEELWWDWFDKLDKVFMDEETADNEVGTGADPSLWVRAVSVVETVVLIFSCIEIPLSFERLPPC